MVLLLALLIPPLGASSDVTSYMAFLPVVQRMHRAFVRDDFSRPTLEPMWSWVNEDPADWSLSARPGFLRLMTHPAWVWTENLLLTDAPEGDVTVTTRVLFRPTRNFQSARLVFYQDEENFLQLGRGYCDLGPPCVGNGITFDLMEGGELVGGNFATSTANEGEAYLQVKRQGATYSGYYSEDGIAWTLIGSHTASAGADLSRVGVGVGGDRDNTRIPADFDFFELRAGSQ
jgi:beta-xylosidase